MSAIRGKTVEMITRYVGGGLGSHDELAAAIREAEGDGDIPAETCLRMLATRANDGDMRPVRYLVLAFAPSEFQRSMLAIGLQILSDLGAAAPDTVDGSQRVHVIAITNPVGSSMSIKILDLAQGKALL